MGNMGGNWEGYGKYHRVLLCINTLTIFQVPGSVWFYQPNKIAPPIFAAAYLASGVVHAWQTK